MSTQPYVQESDAVGSRIKITMASGREGRPEVSVREGTTSEELDRIARLALLKYRELERELAS